MAPKRPHSLVAGDEDEAPSAKRYREGKATVTETQAEETSPAPSPAVGIVQVTNDAVAPTTPSPARAPAAVPSVQPSFVVDDDGLLEAALERRRATSEVVLASAPSPPAQAAAPALEAPAVEAHEKKTKRWWLAPLVAFLATVAFSGESAPQQDAVEALQSVIWARVRASDAWRAHDRFNPRALRLELDGVRDTLAAVEARALGESLDAVRESASLARAAARDALALSFPQNDFAGRLTAVEETLASIDVDMPSDVIDVGPAARRAALAAIPMSDDSNSSGDATVDVAAQVAKRLDDIARQSFDFASTRTGGIVVAANTSQTYTLLPNFFPSLNHPATAVLDRAPPLQYPKLGDCWAFAGTQGHLTVQLALPALPTAFAIAHAPARAAGFGDAASAPRNFEVLGYTSDRHGDQSYHLGAFTFDVHVCPTATFAAYPPPEPVSFVELRVLDNHGARDYTCLYRFAVY